MNTLYISRQTPAAEFKPISYPSIVIERVDPSGLLAIPRVEGFDEPAVCANETVPVRAVRVNSARRPVEILSAYYVWAEDPPGQRFREVFDKPITAAPGKEQITYENEIPPSVQAYVDEKGPTRFAISGVVDVLEPNGVGAIWETPSFLVVSGSDPACRKG